MNRVAIFLLGVILLVPVCTFGIGRLVCGYTYDRDCGGHLKRAADANTVTLAEQELRLALDYLRDHNMTSGSTGVLLSYPSYDVGFWYENLKESYDELEKLTPETSRLEQTNCLQKLRETLLDHGENGKESVTQPSGISIFPNNILWCVFGVVSTLFAIAGAICCGLAFID